MKLKAVWTVLTLIALTSPGFSQMRLTPERVTPEGRRALNSQTDILGEEVLSQGEPSFAKVAQYFPPMVRTRVPISVKDHPDEFIVGYDGTILIKDEELDFPRGRSSESLRRGRRLPALLVGWLPAGTASALEF